MSARTWEAVVVSAAGILELGGGVRLIELPAPRRPASDEVLIEVRAAGVGNWDEFVRTGGWDVVAVRRWRSG